MASVDATGKIKAGKVGTAIITATAASGIKAEIKVTVKKAPSKISLNKKKVTLKKKKTFVIKVKFPSKAASYKITYKSNKKNVAKVSASGKVTAMKKGKATITVKAFNGKSAKLTVTVK